MSKNIIWAVAIAVIVAVGIIAANEYRAGLETAHEVMLTKQAIAAPAEVSVPAVPTATLTSQTTVASLTPQVTPAPSATVAAPGTTVNVIVNCCPEKEVPAAPKAVAKKPMAKKAVAKKKSGSVVVAPAPVAEVSPPVARFEKQPVGPCGSVDCPPTAQVLVGAARFQPAGCAGCP